MSETHFYLIATKRDGKLSGPVKIGISNYAAGRFDALQTASPYELHLVFSFMLPLREMALQFERAFLTVYKSHRMRGEWFDMDPMVALQRMCLCIASTFALEDCALTDEEIHAICEQAGINDALRLSGGGPLTAGPTLQ